MKIICGGQTGGDRAALDAAIALGLDYGGWVPKGGLAEDFPHPPGLFAKYPMLREAETSDPAQRTQWNVRDSDATLILVTERSENASPGTRLTEQMARKLARPLLIVRVDRPDSARRIKDWLHGLGGVDVLNVAGPRRGSTRSPAMCSSALAADDLRRKEIDQGK